ncbi:MAG: NmrA family NAD(P)-binding protein, partial [Chloroflexota bacterium]
AIYHICANMHPDEIAIGQIAIRAAQAAGVTRFVYHSVMHPQTETMPHHWNKLAVEARLFESGLPFTILQPAAYMQNIMASWKAIVEEGHYRVPYSIETRLGMVDLEDVATVAARVLTETGHEGAIYELAGSDILSQSETADVLAKVLQRRVKAEQIPIDDWTQKAEAAGLSPYAIETLLTMFDYYDNFGFWGNSNVLRFLLGREPTSFATFIERVQAS